MHGGKIRFFIKAAVVLSAPISPHRPLPAIHSVATPTTKQRKRQTAIRTNHNREQKATKRRKFAF